LSQLLHLHPLAAVAVAVAAVTLWQILLLNAIDATLQQQQLQQQ